LFEERAAMAVASQPCRSLSVLIADDDSANAQSLALLLRVCGHTVATVSDGQAACDWASRYRPDVIFLDLNMPVLGGLEAARRICALPSSRPPLLVALTACDDADSPDRAHAAGFHLHVLKPAEPVHLEVLLQRLAAALAGRTA
jgi:CheY-like chemotaxis protein